MGYIRNKERKLYPHMNRRTKNNLDLALECTKDAFLLKEFVMNVKIEKKHVMLSTRKDKLATE